MGHDKDINENIYQALKEIVQVARRFLAFFSFSIFLTFCLYFFKVLVSFDFFNSFMF